MHREYVKGVYKQYGAEEQGRKDARENARVWGAFVEGMEMVVGGKRVRGYAGWDEADRDR